MNYVPVAKKKNNACLFGKYILETLKKNIEKEQGETMGTMFPLVAVAVDGGSTTCADAQSGNSSPASRV